MIYLTPNIYIIKRMKKLIDEANDKHTAIREFDLIETIAKELRDGVSKVDTFESVFLDIIDDLPFGLSKLKIIKNIYKRRSLIAFKIWENYEPVRSRNYVGDVLKRYKDKVKNGVYEYIDRPDLNFSIGQVISLVDREYLIDIEHYLPDFLNEKEFIKRIEKEWKRFKEIYSSENQCYVVVSECIIIDELYYTVENDIVKVSKILAVAYYGEGINENGKFIGATIACVEGEIVSDEGEGIMNGDIDANI